MKQLLSKYPRTVIAALTVSAAGLISVAQDEGYRPTAYIPVPGDVPTIGFGDTHGVKLGDRTDPVQALVKLGKHVSDAEAQLRECLGPVKLHPYEWDAYVRLSINVGAGAVCRSSIKPKLQAEQYAAACATILQFNRFKGAPLPGLTARREREHRVCMGGA
jgi:lysozyme